MKLNYRDKVLLTAVIVILVWIAGIMLFIKPAIEGVNDAQKELDDATVTLSDLQDQIEADKDLQQRIDKAYEEVTKVSKHFYDYQEAQNATQIVDNLLADKDHEITNKDMTISAYSTKSLAPYKYSNDIVSTPIDDKVVDYKNETNTDGEDGKSVDKNDKNAKDESELAPQTIGYYTITFDYVGKPEDVKVFCEKLKSNDEKTLIVDTIKVTVDKEDEKLVSGTMELNMMVLQKLTDPNAE